MLDYFSQLYLPGALTIWCATFFSLAALWGYANSLTPQGALTTLPFARRAYAFFALSVVLCGFLMTLLLAIRDFRIEYVFQYSGLDLPIHYQMAALWAGQKGSFLIWLFFGALLGLLVGRTAGKSEPAVMGIYTLTLLGILFILVRENPFVMLKETPLDGQGLNPLLQDDWMVIHPPIMFVGYASTAIPFAFAMASLWRRDYSGWAARAFPWALGGFLVLGSAILLGGYWAYETLGWGGYWGWDPVENASLIPWLLDTVLIHGLYLERTRGRFRRVNYVLAALAYMAVLYGTFLTRSGVLADFSVHSFVDLGISGWLIGLMVGFAALSIYLLATRLPKIPTAPNEDPFLSRGTFLVLSTITITVSTLVITAGTSAPILTRFMENPGQVGPSFYNQVNLPIAILIALLLSAVPYLSWKGNAPGEILRKMIGPLVFAVALSIGAVVWAVREPFHLLFIFLAGLALATNLHKTILKYQAGGLRGAGGYMAHVGVGVMLLGIIASSGYDESTKVTLEMGKPRQVGNSTLTFTRFIERVGREKEGMEIQVERGGETFLVRPRLFMNDRTRQVMANPDIRNFAHEDYYVSPIDFDPGQVTSLELASGSTGQAGDMQVRFDGFDIQAEGGGNAMAAMQQGLPITIVTKVAVTRNGKTQELQPIYRFDPVQGGVVNPSLPLASGGSVAVAGIVPINGTVQLAFSGLESPPRLSIDVTRKPLIKLVWYGFYVVLIGGLIATFHRFREARVRERVGEI
jgi:cytochrome c-type biogenesis protein CcmF